MDSDAANPDSASLTFTIRVQEDLVPTFEQASIPDKTYVQNLAIDSEALPAATGGDGVLTYTISPDLPTGLIFDPATRLLSGTPAAPQLATLYTYTATDSDAANPDSASLTFTVTVAEDLVPTFQQVSIPDKTYVQNLAIDSEALPAATGGDGVLTYTISPDLPTGLNFDPATRLLSGTPAAPQLATLYTYTATDSDTANPDSASLTFTVTVAEDLVPTFQQVSIPDKNYVQNLAIDSEALPAATGGDGVLTYTISPDLPTGLNFDPATRLLSGTPAAPQPATLYTYTAMDSDAANPDSASLTFTIRVQEDLVPTFEQASIPDKTYVQNLAIDSEALPAATGGDGVLTYTISPDLPTGLIFDPATRLLSGTPAAPQLATLYTYTATDSDAANPDSASLTFTVTVAEDLVPTFQQVSIPDKTYVQNLAIDSEALPAATGGDGVLSYAISPDLPAGLYFDPATRLLSGTPTAPQLATLYTYTATDSDTANPDSASLTFTVTVAEDLVPTFQQASIPDKTYVQNLAIDSEALPAATGGDGVLSYAISPDLPAGLYFDPATRLLSGTPAAPQPATLYTYTATDNDTANPDSASLTFTIRVQEDLVPTFEQASIPDKFYVQNLPIDSETLPAATGGDGVLTYAISPDLPAGLNFDPATRLLSGTPAAPQPATLYAYTATDSDAANPDSASLPFTIRVQEDLAPTFEQASIPDKTYVQNLAIDSEALPAATGGDGVLTYAISPDLPTGLNFDPATRLLSGTPAAPQPATLYTYTATDSDAANPDSASLTFTIRVQEDLMPTFEQASIADKSYERGLAIVSEALPAATGGDGALTYAISPDLPAGLAFDPATRLLSGTPTAPQPATLYTYTATDSDTAGPDTAALAFTITVEAIALVDISAAVAEVGEGDDHTPIAVTVTLSEAVLGDVTITLASTGSARLGSDFDLASDEVTVVEGSTQATTTITPIRDLEAEGDEIITLDIDSLVGNGEIGVSSSVHIDIRDLGSLSKDEYAELNAYMLFSGGEPYDIDTDALYLAYVVRNTGRVAASPTEAALLTTTDYYSENRQFRRLTAWRPVPALEPSGRSVGTIRVPFRDLVPGSNNYLVFVVSPVAEEAPDSGNVRDLTAVFLTDGRRIPTTCTGFTRDTQPGTPDPLFEQQWALRNTGQMSFAANGGVAGEDLNMEQTLADGPTGAGVQVAVVDSGLEICHPDLAANVEPGLSYNFNHPYWFGAKADDPFPPTVFGDHGTSVAGLIAAAANNGIGGRGVAPQAHLRGFNFLEGQFNVPSSKFDSLGMSSESPRSDDVHVFNMSFGSSGSANSLDADERELFRVGVSDLRDGRGALYVKTAGNAFNHCTELDDDGQPVAPRLDLSVELGCFAANLDGTNNLPYVTVIGAFSANGERSSYSSAGATLWVVAPAGEFGRDRPAMITTDQMGSARGYVLRPRGLAAGTDANPLGDYTSIFSGTSAAAPNASGAVALLLETQPELTWRDVKHVLAKTARPLHTDIPPVRVAFGGTPAVLQHGWITNAAGYRFHNWYGFGAIDVDAAVALAATHAPNSLGAFIESGPFRLATGVTVPDHDGGGLTQTQNATGLSRTANIEAVQLRIEVTHDSPRELGFELTSPSGTRNVINPVFNEALYGVDNPLDWTILSNAFYGESPTGQWTLNVIDAAEGTIGALDAWSLIFYLGEHPEDN